MHLIRLKHITLLLIIVLALWALWPPRGGGASSGPGQTFIGSRSAAYHIRIHPGPMYLPGLVPENATKPIEGMARVGREFVKVFPDTAVEFVSVPAGQREWLVTQLSSAQAPDVIQVNVEDAWQDVQKGWYVPLDEYLEQPNPFAQPGEPGSARWWDMFKYPIPTRGTMAPNGKMYCIVLDMIETGIYYNKSIFARLHLREPRDWAEFLELQEKLKQAGYTPLLVSKEPIADWGVDLLFDQLYGELRPLLDLNYDPRRGDYLKGYLDWDEIVFLHGKGFFQPGDPRWEELWRILKAWRAYMPRDLSNSDWTKPFVTQQGAMHWQHSMFVNRLVKDPDRQFEWGIFYLPPIPQSYSRFARGRPMCVIGGSAMQYHITNSALSDTPSDWSMEKRIAESQRLKRVVAWLQFLTTPRSCDTVVNEVVALLPNVKGVEPHPELAPFDEFLQRDYSMSKWFYTFGLQFDEVMLRMLELYLNNGMSQDEFMAWMQRNIERASENIVRRKDLDLANLQQEWDNRAELRKQFSELPGEAD